MQLQSEAAKLVPLDTEVGAALSLMLIGSPEPIGQKVTAMLVNVLFLFRNCIFDL